MIFKTLMSNCCSLTMHCERWVLRIFSSTYTQGLTSILLNNLIMSVALHIGVIVDVQSMFVCSYIKVPAWDCIVTQALRIGFSLEWKHCNYCMRHIWNTMKPHLRSGDYGVRTARVNCLSWLCQRLLCQLIFLAGLFEKRGNIKCKYSWRNEIFLYFLQKGFISNSASNGAAMNCVAKTRYYYRSIKQPNLASHISFTKCIATVSIPKYLINNK